MLQVFNDQLLSENTDCADVAYSSLLGTLSQLKAFGDNMDAVEDHYKRLDDLAKDIKEVLNEFYYAKKQLEKNKVTTDDDKSQIEHGGQDESSA